MSRANWSSDRHLQISYILKIPIITTRFPQKIVQLNGSIINQVIASNRPKQCSSAILKLKPGSGSNSCGCGRSGSGEVVAILDGRAWRNKNARCKEERVVWGVTKYRIRWYKDPRSSKCQQKIYEEHVKLKSIFKALNNFKFLILYLWEITAILGVWLKQMLNCKFKFGTSPNFSATPSPPFYPQVLNNIMKSRRQCYQQTQM